jgi:hypothetical protein
LSATDAIQGVQGSSFSATEQIGITTAAPETLLDSHSWLSSSDFTFNPNAATLPNSTTPNPDDLLIGNSGAVSAIFGNSTANGSLTNNGDGSYSYSPNFLTSLFDRLSNSTDSFSYQVVDQHNVASFAATATINKDIGPSLTAINLSSSLWIQGNRPVQIEPATFIIDHTDTANLNGATLAATVTAGGTPVAGDLLTISNSGEVTTTTTNSGTTNIIYFNGNEVATYTYSSATDTLVINFNAQATPKIANAVADNITFSSTVAGSALSTAQRNFTMQFADSTGTLSNTISHNINVQLPSTNGTASTWLQNAESFKDRKNKQCWGRSPRGKAPTLFDSIIHFDKIFHVF